MTRTFNATPAKRARVPLLIGIAGPSGSGKTYSALELAVGIQRVQGGDIDVIDTEAGRALHYAHDDKCGHFAGRKCTVKGHFTFNHIEFKPPFGCLDYLDAIRYSVERGNIPVIDSASHMHEGQGGMLDQHEDAIDAALGRDKDDARRRADVSWRCWRKPKEDMGRFVQCLLQLKASVIFCFRAKEKLKPGQDEQRKKIMVNQGIMAIADDSLIYEMVVQPLLEPGSRGVPNWRPAEAGSRFQTKLPEFFGALEDMKGKPLSADMGELMARWAMGSETPTRRVSEPVVNLEGAGLDTWTAGLVVKIGMAEDMGALASLHAQANKAKAALSESDKESIRAAIEKRKSELQ